jgi:recombination protein RecR
MQHYPQSIQALIRSFSKLPGIGEKTAERLAIHVLKRPLNEAEQLARSIVAVKKNVRLCSSCFGLSDDEQCRVCRDESRDATVLCIVEQPADMISIEKSGAFNGYYHILGGCLSPLEGIGPDDLRIKELLVRIRQGVVKEVVLATGTSVEGASTADYLSQQLRGPGIRLTRIASGVPVGGDLKYIDKMTIKAALDSRHDI